MFCFINIMVILIAGHISQAPSSVREVVGTISELRRFVARHLTTFELQGELVSLRAANSTSSNVDSNGPRGGGGAGNGTCVASRNRPQTLKLDCSSPQVMIIYYRVLDVS